MAVLRKVDLLEFPVSHVDDDVASLLLDDDRLVTHAAHHVERLDRILPDRQALGVLADALLDGRFHGIGHLEEAVRRHGASDPLVGPLKVVVAVDPEPEALTQVVDRPGDDAIEEFLLEVLPESLDLPERLGMVRARDDVLDPFARQFLLEGAPAPPRVVLPALVRKDFLRSPVLGDRVP
jgi:hypothetical protein